MGEQPCICRPISRTGFGRRGGATRPKGARTGDILAAAAAELGTLLHGPGPFHALAQERYPPLPNVCRAVTPEPRMTGKVCSPAPRARETLFAPVGGSVGVLNLRYAWWLLTAVIVVFAALLWYILGGWERPRIVVPLVSVLAPVCALAAVFAAMALSLVITEPLKPPSPPQDGGTDLRTTPARTRPATTRSAEPASPTVAPSPAATASATPSASPSASPGARTPR